MKERILEKLIYLRQLFVEGSVPWTVADDAIQMLEQAQVYEKTQPKHKQ